MKKILSNTLKALAVVALGVGVIYASGNFIKTLNQTAYQGDKITPDWINAVNKRLTTPDATSLPVFLKRAESYSGIATNVSNWNTLLGKAVTGCKGIFPENELTYWKDTCKVSGTPTSYVMDGIRNGGDQEEIYHWCAQRVCDCALGAWGSISQMHHCGNGTGSCPKAGYAVKCLYTDD